MSYNFFYFRLKNVLGNRLEIILTSNIEITDTRPAHITLPLTHSLTHTPTHICPTL